VNDARILFHVRRPLTRPDSPSDVNSLSYESTWLAMLTDHYPLRLLVTERHRITADAYCLLVCALQILLLTYLLIWVSCSSHFRVFSEYDIM